MSAPSALPPNATALERAVEGAIAALDLEVDFARLLDPWRCPREALPFLAWHLSVDDWSEGYPEVVLRGLVAGSVAAHRTRGTVGAVRAALDAVGFADATVTERGSAQRYDGSRVYDGATAYDVGGHWAAYRVAVPRPMTEAQAAEVRRVCERAAPLRCHLAELTYAVAARLYDGSAAYAAAGDPDPIRYGGIVDA